MGDIFKALSDPTRRQILLMVSENPQNINLIKESFEMSRPAISKHIKILQESKLIDIRLDSSDGRQRNCYAQLEAMSEVKDYLMQLEKFWDQKLDGLGDFLNENKKL